MQIKTTNYSGQKTNKKINLTVLNADDNVEQLELS